MHPLDLIGADRHEVYHSSVLCCTPISPHKAFKSPESHSCPGSRVALPHLSEYIAQQCSKWRPRLFLHIILVICADTMGTTTVQSSRERNAYFMVEPGLILL